MNETETAELDGAITRRLELDGVYNLRDIGGYPIADGRQTRWRMLWRSDSLHRLTPESQHELLAHGVRTIIDLRYREEVAGSPNVFAGSPSVAYNHLSLYELTDPLVAEYGPQNLLDIYHLILDLTQVSIKRVFDTLSAPGALPAVIHCTAGKDRTGMMIALILGALGVPDETIVEDYALSARYLAPLLGELRAQAAHAGHDLDWYNRLLDSNPDTMRQALAYLRERHGGATAYLRGIGVSDQQLQHLQTALAA